MKREILFRGKRVDNGKWIEGSLILPTTDRISTIIIAWNGTRFEVDPETVGQFTGLTDNNGKMVFEGDIVKTFRGSFYRVEDIIEFHSWIERQFARNPELVISGNFHES